MSIKKLLSKIFKKKHTITVSGQNIDGEHIHYTQRFKGSITDKEIGRVGHEAGIVACLSLDRVV